MKCNQCEMVSINGRACHESGCPNRNKVWDADTEEWHTLFECRECGAHYTDRFVAAECCGPQQESQS